MADIVDRDDGVLDVVENGLQMRGGLLANLARQRLRLVGHQLHGAHDAAPFGVDPIVVRADDLEQRRKIQLAAAAARLRDLPLQQEWFKLSAGCAGSLRIAAAISRDKSLISRT